MPSISLPLLLAVLTLPCAAAVTEHRITCPSEVSRKTLAITGAPNGWTGFVPFEYQPGLPLNSAGVMYGAPQTMAVAKPSYTDRTAWRAAARSFHLGMSRHPQDWLYQAARDRTDN